MKEKILTLLNSLNSMSNILKDIEQDYESLINKMDNHPILSQKEEEKLIEVIDKDNIL